MFIQEHCFICKGQKGKRYSDAHTAFCFLDLFWTRCILKKSHINGNAFYVGKDTIYLGLSTDGAGAGKVYVTTSQGSNYFCKDYYRGPSMNHLKAPLKPLLLSTFEENSPGLSPSTFSVVS